MTRWLWFELDNRGVLGLLRVSAIVSNTGATVSLVGGFQYETASIEACVWR